VLVPNNVVFTEVSPTAAPWTPGASPSNCLHRGDFNDLSRLVDDALAPFEAIVRPPAPKVTIQKVGDGTATIGVEYWQRGAGRGPDRGPSPALTEHFPDGGDHRHDGRWRQVGAP